MSGARLFDFGEIVNDVASTDYNTGEHVPGSCALDYYDARYRRTAIYDDIEHFAVNQDCSYEEDVFNWLQRDDIPGCRVIIGGLGCGKTALCHYVANELCSNIEIGCDRRRDGVCSRKPLYIDCNDVLDGYLEDEFVREVLRKIRHGIYEDLIRGWRERMGFAVTLPEAKYLALRRLMIANDILEQDGAATITGVDDERLAIDVGGLLHVPRSWKDVEEIVKAHSSEIKRFAGKLRTRLDEEKPLSLAYTKNTLKAYYNGCNVRTNARSLIIIDNVDAQPTSNIDKLMEVLHHACLEDPRIRMLVPLRPSSLSINGRFVAAIRGNTHTPSVRIHYGADPAEVIQKRIVKFVLSRSLESLADSVPDNFPEEDKDKSAFAIVLYSWLFLKMLEAGAKISKRPFDPGPIDAAVKETHSYLENIILNRAAVENLGTTLFALTGNSVRYCFNIYQRFISNMMKDELVADYSVERAMYAQQEQGVKLGTSYSVIINAILLDGLLVAGAHFRVERIFSNSRRAMEKCKPDLTKLFILRQLYTHRTRRVGDLAADLALVGISQDEVIEAIESLADRRGVLLWLSTNRKLGNEDNYLDEYAVISEHGRSYWEYVVGDFEYLWYSGAKIDSISDIEKIGFVKKVGLYCNLIDRISEEEFAHVLFRRLSWNDTGIGVGEGSFTMTILVNSLVRAASTVVAVQDSDKKHGNNLWMALSRMLENYEKWDRRTRYAYGRTRVYGVAQEAVGLCVMKLKQIAKSLGDLDLDKVKIADVCNYLAELLEEPKELIINRVHKAEHIPEMYCSLVVESIPGYAERDALNAPSGFERNLQKYIETRGRLTWCIDLAVPDHSTVRTILKEMQNRLEGMETMTDEWDLEDHRLTRWVARENSRISEWLAILKNNRYNSDDGFELRKMEKSRQKCRNILDLLRKICGEYGIEMPVS